MNKILEKLMSVLPLVESGSTEVIQLASEIKAAAQDAQIWTEAHENVFQTAVAAVNTPPSTAPVVQTALTDEQP